MADCTDIKGSALAKTDMAMVREGLMTPQNACEAKGGTWNAEGEALQAKNVPPIRQEFEGNRQELSSNERDFMQRYDRQALFANNGVASPDPASKQITPEIMEGIDAQEARHPIVQRAFDDVMGRPEAFNL